MLETYCRSQSVAQWPCVASKYGKTAGQNFDQPASLVYVLGGLGFLLPVQFAVEAEQVGYEQPPPTLVVSLPSKVGIEVG